MRNFSLDLAAENIHSDKTKEYFQEVIKSYYNENYRSAIVMLYSVTLTDLILKLKALKEVYNDEKAIIILEKIEKLQSENSTSPEWESKLIELVKQQTNLLEQSDFLNIQNLQKLRHLCAHPIITQNYELYRPNKETVRAHIRNILEGLLIKPPLLSRKIFDDLVADLNENKNILINDKDLERYLSAKYFKNINIYVEKQLFKSLWKITYRIDAVQCNQSREINARTIKLFLNRNYNEIIQELKSDKDYYSKLNQVAIREVIDLVNNFPEIYKILSEEAKLLIEAEINSDADLKAYAWFLSSEIKEHVDYLLSDKFNPSEFDKKYISTDTILHLAYVLCEHADKADANRLLIYFFGISGTYDTADVRYSQLIKSHLNEFTIDEYKQLLDIIEGNSQIYYRRQANSTNNEIRYAVLNKDQNFDFTPYYHFRDSIGL
jgi:hypothetical protein